jgi:hypothetical protein
MEQGQAPPYNAPYPQQQTVVIVNQQPNDNITAAACCGCWLGLCFSPVMYHFTHYAHPLSGLIPLCCFKSKKAQAVICIGAGIGGLVTALCWFGLYSSYNEVANGVDDGNYNLNAYADSYSSSFDISGVDSDLDTTWDGWGVKKAVSYYDSDGTVNVEDAVSSIIRTLATIFLVIGILGRKLDK